MAKQLLGAKYIRAGEVPPLIVDEAEVELECQHANEAKALAEAAEIERKRQIQKTSDQLAAERAKLEADKAAMEAEKSRLLAESKALDAQQCKIDEANKAIEKDRKRLADIEVEQKAERDRIAAEQAKRDADPVDRITSDTAKSFQACAYDLTFNNREKLTAACEHIFKIFRDSSGPQIGGRKFFGVSGFELVWNCGECIDIKPFSKCSDRVQK